MTCYEYILNVQQALEKEDTNADTFLQVHTKRQIIDIVLTECVEKHAEQITELNQGVKDMFAGNKIDELKKVYDVFI